MGQRSSGGGRGAGVLGVAAGGAVPPREHPPSAGSIRHLSWSPWRPRTERGGAAASGWWVHGAPRSPRALAKWKNRYNLIWDKSLYKNCHFEDSFKLYLVFVLFHLESVPEVEYLHSTHRVTLKVIKTYFYIDGQNEFIWWKMFS